MDKGLIKFNRLGLLLRGLLLGGFIPEEGASGFRNDCGFNDFAFSLKDITESFFSIICKNILSKAEHSRGYFYRLY